MRIALASDHAGYPLKEDLRAFLEEEGQLLRTIAAGRVVSSPS